MREEAPKRRNRNNRRSGGPAPETEEAIETATEDTESQETVTGEAMVALTYDDGPTAETRSAYWPHWTVSAGMQPFVLKRWKAIRK